MKKIRGIALLLLFSLAMNAAGQYSKEFKRIFLDADYLYETGFYEEAYNRYNNLLQLDPGNSNILFRLGASCLNIPGREKEAITYLAEAANNVSTSYDVRSQTETSAPVMAYFMLGQAYHVDNAFDLATEFYEKYVSSGRDEDPLQIEFAEMQIEACERGKEMVEQSFGILFSSVLDNFEDNLPSINNPVVSGDGNILIFLVDYPADKKIMMTTKEGTTWTKPRNINSEIGMVGETFPVSLSYDGQELYLMHEFYSHSDLFVSKYEGGMWSEAEPLNRNINKKTFENHASISRDGTTLYFTSDRRGGYGSFDIYVSTREPGGDWGPAENIGEPINTPYEEETPFITENDSILFFSSQGHATIGGLDVFFSERNPDGSWQEPLNVGYPVSTTDDNLFFNPGWDNFEGYYAVRKDNDPSSNTINMVLQFDTEEEAEEFASTYHDELYKEPETGDIKPVAVGAKVVVLASVIPDDEEVPEPLNTQESITHTATASSIPPAETNIVPDEVVVYENPKAAETLKKPVVTSNEVVPSGPYSLATGIPFDFNDHNLNLSAIIEVEKIFDLMQRFPETKIELSGHADAIGASDYNMSLSVKRAETVTSYLSEKGIRNDRISYKGKGEQEPVALNRDHYGNDTPAGRFLNRHVIVTFSGLKQTDSGLNEFYVPMSLRPIEGSQDYPEAMSNLYTIQVLASTKPAALTYFTGLDGVKEYKGKDKFYRYTYGEYETKDKALERLKELKTAGYPDAFIKRVRWYRAQ